MASTGTADTDHDHKWYRRVASSRNDNDDHHYDHANCAEAAAEYFGRGLEETVSKVHLKRTALRVEGSFVLRTSV